MKVKVHWIIDGVADIEAETPEEAENKVENELSKFMGCFLTGTAAEVTPVSQIDNYKFGVCNLIKDLSDSYQALVRKKTAA